MAILRQSPFRQLRELERQIDDMIQRDSDTRENDGSAALTKWKPSVDVYEEGDNVVFEVEAPGINKDDLDVSLEDNRLTISGERREEKSVDEDQRNYFRSERVYGTFKRSFTLPDSLERDSITASYNDGVLTVEAPKKEETPSQDVQIQ